MRHLHRNESTAYNDAFNQAQANADYFRVPYVIFRDTAGAWNSERWCENAIKHNTGSALIVPPRAGRELR